MPDDVRSLADSLHTRLLGASPFDASLRGIPGYDALVPDASVEADEALRADVLRLAAGAAAIDTDALSTADRVTLDCVADTAERTVLHLDAAPGDLTVTPMPITGPPVLLAVAARTVIGSPAAAEDYLERLVARRPGWARRTTGCATERAGAGCRWRCWSRRRSSGPTASSATERRARCSCRSPPRGGTAPSAGVPTWKTWYGRSSRRLSPGGGGCSPRSCSRCPDPRTAPAWCTSRAARRTTNA